MTVEKTRKNNQNHLFICGCPRSGTTALWDLMTADGQCVLGVERYGLRFFEPDFLSPDLFELPRFMTLKDGDTFYSDLSKFESYYDRVPNLHPHAKFVGDKIPLLYNYFEALNNNFPKAIIIMIFRNIFDVATSYKVRFTNPADDWKRDIHSAINDWNAAAQNALAYMSRGNIVILDYEKLFMTDFDPAAIYQRIGIEPSQDLYNHYNNLKHRSAELDQSRERVLSSSEVKTISMKADFDSYRKILEFAL